LKKEGTAFFLKGKNWRTELQKAQEVWQFDYEEVTSETNVEAVLLVIKGIERV
jgi:16S rRNA (guanine527-N7)-methyltransferase